MHKLESVLFNGRGHLRNEVCEVLDILFLCLLNERRTGNEIEDSQVVLEHLKDKVGFVFALPLRLDSLKFQLNCLS